MTAAPHPLAVTPGRALIMAGVFDVDHPIDAAEKAASMLMHRGNFPFPVCPLSGTKRKHVVRIVDIEAALAAKAEDAVALPPSPLQKRRRGRPRKVSRASQLDP